MKLRWPFPTQVLFSWQKKTVIADKIPPLSFLPWMRTWLQKQCQPSCDFEITSMRTNRIWEANSDIIKPPKHCQLPFIWFYIKSYILHSVIEDMLLMYSLALGTGFSLSLLFAAWHVSCHSFWKSSPTSKFPPFVTICLTPWGTYFLFFLCVLATTYPCWYGYLNFPHLL